MSDIKDHHFCTIGSLARPCEVEAPSSFCTANKSFVFLIEKYRIVGYASILEQEHQFRPYGIMALLILFGKTRL
jgi:hypothetical protein